MKRRFTRSINRPPPAYPRSTKVNASEPHSNKTNYPHSWSRPGSIDTLCSRTSTFISIDITYINEAVSLQPIATAANPCHCAHTSAAQVPRSRFSHESETISLRYGDRIIICILCILPPSSLPSSVCLSVCLFVLLLLPFQCDERRRRFVDFSHKRVIAHSSHQR